MPDEMTKRMWQALEGLRTECSYEGSQSSGSENYVARSKLGLGIGKKTLSDLQELGFVVEGKHRLTGKLGYKITELGLKQLAQGASRRKLSTRKHLSEVPPRLQILRGRLED